MLERYRRFQFSSDRLAPASVAALSLLACCSPAFAYRPFDGTDAAVAEKGEVEIELQPAAIAATSFLAPSSKDRLNVSSGRSRKCSTKTSLARSKRSQVWSA